MVSLNFPSPLLWMLVHPLPLPAQGTCRQRTYPDTQLHAHQHAMDPQAPALTSSKLDAPNQDTKHRNKTGRGKGKKGKRGKKNVWQEPDLGQTSPGAAPARQNVPTRSHLLRDESSAATRASRSSGSLELLGIHPKGSETGARLKPHHFPGTASGRQRGRMAARPGRSGELAHYLLLAAKSGEEHKRSASQRPQWLVEISRTSWTRMTYWK